MSHKKRLQDVIPARSGRAKKQEPKKESPRAVEPAGVSGWKRRRTAGSRSQGTKRKKRLLIYGTVSAVGVGFLIVIVAALFSQSVVRITPKMQSEHVSATLLAYRGDEQRDDTIPFELVKLSDEAAREVKATEVKQVDRRASGTIVVYNDYGTQNQRLIKNTRFETPDGNIYRIHESIVVPGQTESPDGSRAPGSVEATVYADEPGEEYNMPPQDFTIPGFAGTPRFEGFYARSKTPLSGGFSGVVKTVSDDVKTEVRNALQEELREQLQKQARAQIPEQFILFPDASFMEFSMEEDSSAQERLETGTVTITARAHFYGVIFDREDLGSILAGRLFAENIPTEGVYLENPSVLDFTFIDKEHFDPAEDTQFSFSLSGTPKFVWSYDQSALKAQIAGLGRDEVTDVFARIPAIDHAEVILRPFWKQSLPSEPKDITIETVK